MASNKQSKFSPFTLSLEDNVKITGIKYVPDSKSTAQQLSQKDVRPLIVLIHGGTCTAHNFDIAPGALTVSTAADIFSFPVVSINRPGYLDSTPLKIAEGATYHRTLGEFHHTCLFPALWREFGVPNRCTAMVPLAHSMGSPGLIVASALYSQDPKSKYSLAGIIFSGWGIRSIPHTIPSPEDQNNKVPWKKMIMLADPKYHCASSEAHAAIETQDHPMDYPETEEFGSGRWNSYWREYSDRITVPIMFGQPEFDLFWEGTEEHIREYRTMFPKCSRFDGSLVLRAPHAIEWSHVAQGWYARCFGFALEVCTWM